MGGGCGQERGAKPQEKVSRKPTLHPPCLGLTHVHRKWAKQWAIIKGEDPCDPTYDPAEDANP